jgi:drug/metabolite transporter (DMT)-like permease
MFATFVLYGAGHIAYAKTLQLVEASAFPILFATQAVWIMGIGVLFFPRILHWWQVLGSLLIFGGVALLSRRPKGASKFKLEQGVVLGLLTGLLFGIASVTMGVCRKTC